MPFEPTWKYILGSALGIVLIAAALLFVDWLHKRDKGSLR